MTLLYGGSFLAIAFLWRPTSNNARYGLEELPGDSATADSYDLEMVRTGGNDAAGESRKRTGGEVIFDSEVHSDNGEGGHKPVFMLDDEDGDV